jgi:uncharacterized protein (DUF1800 family)
MNPFHFSASSTRRRGPRGAILGFLGVLGVLAVHVCFAAGIGAPLGFDDARHLLNRTSLAGTPEDIASFGRLTRQQAAERLLGAPSGAAITPPPAWVDEPFQSLRRFRTMSAEERKLAQREVFQRSFELQSWWLTEFLATRSPLAEKMTLFWHNHFVTSFQKVRSPQLLYRQNVLLRSHALGNFGELLRAVARDPAMLIYLDNAISRKEQPNENFARELMELFTLGEGNYGEQDVKEAARAFTGWSVEPETGKFLFREQAHDGGVKTVLGRTGSFDGGAVLDILLAQPQTAEFVAGKLWREFVSPVADPVEVRRIARAFRESGYDIRTALNALLVSDAFYAPQNRAALIKSPIELVVGTLRQFDFKTGEVLPFVVTANQLGQRLFAPPNVKGWPGGEAWINSTTFLARKAFLERLFRVEELRAMPAGEMAGGMGEQLAAARLAPGQERYLRAMLNVHFDAGQWLARLNGGEAGAVQRVLLATAPVAPAAPGIKGMDLIRQVTQDAAYQLK